MVIFHFTSTDNIFNTIKLHKRLEIKRLKIRRNKEI